MAREDTLTTTVGARELKTRLGKYLRIVRHGATIVVTDRGEPVAELRPIAAAGGVAGARWSEAAARGDVSLGTGEPAAPWEPLAYDGPPLSDAISEDRDERA